MSWCVVWRAHRDALGPGHGWLLSPEEEERREGFLRSVDRDRSVLAAVLLRLAVSAATGADPRTLEVGRRCPRCARPHGRPRVPHHDVELSVSHSGELAVVAVSHPDPVGVDIEQVKEMGFESVLGQVLAPDEARPRSLVEFLTLWTRKESVVKATGEGLAVPMGEVALGHPDDPPRLRSYAGRPLAGVLADLHVPEGYVGAVTVLGDEAPVIHERDGGSLVANASRRD